MKIVTKGFGDSQMIVTKGYGTSILAVVKREVVRLVSRIINILSLESKI
jgi:hypothetical protein